MQKILITGVPGTGKTTIGDYIAKTFDFVHVDMEADNYRPIHEIEADAQGFIAMLNEHEKTVLSWGFSPYEHRHSVEALVAEGFELVWLDGNRVASFANFMHREQHNDVMEKAYYAQLLRIIESDIVGQLHPRLMNPFDSNGAFRPVADIAAEVVRPSVA